MPLDRSLTLIVSFLDVGDSVKIFANYLVILNSGYMFWRRSRLGKSRDTGATVLNQISQGVFQPHFISYHTRNPDKLQIKHYVMPF